MRGGGGSVGAVRALGLTAGTRVATPGGWRAVDTLAAGQAAITFDAGPQPLAAVHRAVLGAADLPRRLWPRRVPAAALGLTRDLLLPADQPLLVEGESVEALTGEPFALIPAHALDGWRGIRPVEPRPGLTVVTLDFGRPRAVYAQGRAILACGGAGGLVHLTPAEAELWTALAMAEDLGLALRAARAAPQAARAGGANRP